jgi:hypothetical protein
MYDETETTPGALAATRQTWRHEAVRDLLADIVAANPTASDKSLLDKFIGRLREDDDYFLAAGAYAFDNALRALRREQQRPTAAQKAAAASKRAQEAAEHARMVSRIKVKVLLNILTPNGKKLRACTGEECQHFGGWYQRIAEKIGPTQLVGDVLKEKDLRALYRAA